MLSHPHLSTALAVVGALILSLAGPLACSSDCQVQLELRCTDGLDDDDDGLTDCADADCALDPGCDPSECGNDKAEAGEQCDGPDLNDASCASLGHVAGQLACADDCTFDLIGCAAAACGNDLAEAGEQCDGPDLDDASCASLGYVGGQLACADDCTFDLIGCAAADCGNDLAEAGEQCDGPDLDDASCASLGYVGGQLACADDCTFDLIGCAAADCGNDLAEAGEQCDGPDLDDASCASLGYASGQLACADDCTFAPQACIPAVCGDGQVEGLEECEGNDPGLAVCADVGHDAGQVFCLDDCRFDYSDCSTCGDDQVTGSESCDGQAPISDTCASLGMGIGVLSCSEYCVFDTSACDPALVPCATPGPRLTAWTGTITCVTTVGEIQFDNWVVPVQPGDCVDIKVDNGAGAADLLAWARDPSGAYYGLANDYSELDDEIACSMMPWNGFACPAASVTAASAGDMLIGIAQWSGGIPTETCADDAAYSLYVAVNGVEISPVQIGDDQPL